MFQIVYLSLIAVFTTTQLIAAVNQDECKASYEGLYQCNNFHGPHLQYRPDLENITEIIVQGSYSELIIDPNFRNLESIRLYTSTKLIKTIDFSSYKNFTHLKEFIVVGNNVGRIVTDGVESMINLKTIKVESGSIEVIDAVGFKPFPALENLWLLEVGYYSRFDFNSLPTTLVELDLSLTTTYFNIQAVKYFSNLTYLNLSHNKLQSFNISLLPSSIVTLDLSGTGTLASITCTDVSDLTNLTHISFNAGKLTDTEFRCIPDNVEHLSYSYNKISSISSCDRLKRLSKLKVLKLDHNELKDFDFDCLNENVEHIHLENNIIKNLNIKSLWNHRNTGVHIEGNQKFNCSCSFLIDFLELITSPEHESQFVCTANDGYSCIDCYYNSEHGFAISIVKYSSRFGNRSDHEIKIKGHNLGRLKNWDDGYCLSTYNKVPENATAIGTRSCKYENMLGLYPKIYCDDYTHNFFEYYDNIGQVERLDIRGNFSSLNIDSRYENVTYLKLQSDNLIHFNFASLRNVSNLKALDLSNNRIQTVDTRYNYHIYNLPLSDSFNNNTYLTRLNVIYLNNNELSQITLKQFPDEVRKLDFSHNNISAIIDPNVRYMRLMDLRELLLGHNQLNYFDMNEVNIKVRKLDLSNNNISEINKALLNIYTLEELLLSNNNLSYFDMSTCYGWTKMDLSHNSISSIKYDTTPHVWYDPDELLLNHNKLKHFDINSLKCASLRKLNLSHNSISTFAYTAKVNGIKLPQVVDLSWNALTHLNVSSVWSIYPSEVILNNNNISAITSESKLNQSSVSLKIFNNPINCDCQFFNTYTAVLANATTCTKETCFKCRNGSDLMIYPWYSNLTQLQDFDKTSKACFRSNGTIYKSSVMMMFVSFVLYFLA